MSLRLPCKPSEWPSHAGIVPLCFHNGRFSIVAGKMRGGVFVTCWRPTKPFIFMYYACPYMFSWFLFKSAVRVVSFHGSPPPNSISSLTATNVIFLARPQHQSPIRTPLLGNSCPSLAPSHALLRQHLDPLWDKVGPSASDPAVYFGLTAIFCAHGQDPRRCLEGAPPRCHGPRLECGVCCPCSVLAVRALRPPVCKYVCLPALFKLLYMYVL